MTNLNVTILLQNKFKMLTEKLLHIYIADACRYAAEPVTNKVLWLYGKYVFLMEDTCIEDESDLDSPQHLNDIMVMLACISGRIFRATDQERLEDLRTAYLRANLALDESESPYRTVITRTSDYQSEVDIVKSIDVPQPQSKEESIKDMLILENQEFKSDLEDTILRPNLQAVSIDKEMDKTIADKRNPHESREKDKRPNLFFIPNIKPIRRKDLNRLIKACYDMPSCDVILARQKTCKIKEIFWNSNILEYDKLTTNYEDILHMAYNRDDVPGLGISSGERRLLLGSCNFNACKWNPSTKMKKFITAMHKPWFQKIHP